MAIIQDEFQSNVFEILDSLEDIYDMINMAIEALPLYRVDNKHTRPEFLIDYLKNMRDVIESIIGGYDGVGYFYDETFKSDYNTDINELYKQIISLDDSLPLFVRILLMAQITYEKIMGVIQEIPKNEKTAPLFDKITQLQDDFYNGEEGLLQLIDSIESKWSTSLVQKYKNSISDDI